MKDDARRPQFSASTKSIMSMTSFVDAPIFLHGDGHVLSRRKYDHNGKFPPMTDRGFTFIELIVVMILLAFAGSLVYVSVGRSIGGNQAKMFARELTVMMKTARRLAVEQGAPSRLIVSSQDRTCFIDGEKQSLKIPEQIQLDAEAIQQRDDGGIEIVFYADGSTNGGILSILVDNMPRYRIGVDILTGTIQVKSGDDAAV